MRKLLRGNYRLNKSVKARSRKGKRNISDEFEAKAIEKLGGSIAFVSKPGFLWSGKDEGAA